MCCRAVERDTVSSRVQTQPCETAVRVGNTQVTSAYYERAVRHTLSLAEIPELGGRGSASVRRVAVVHCKTKQSLPSVYDNNLP